MTALIAALAIIGAAFAFIIFAFLFEVVLDFLYQFSPAFRRWYRDFYHRCKG